MNKNEHKPNTLVVAFSLFPEMDLIHSLSNLEIETHHPHSSSKKEVEDEVRRNWVELPADVMSLIFLKLDYVDTLRSAQWVCTSWWNLSKQPHLFRSIHLENVFKLEWEMAREAIDRSSGQLAKFSVQDIANDELLHYMSEKSSSLRCIRLSSCYSVSDNGLIEMAKKLPQLEEFEIFDGPSCISKNVFETFGRFCPRLNSCKLNFLPDAFTVTDFHSGQGLGLAIAENMPELGHLDLSSYMLTDDGLRAILDGCPHLEYLNLRGCYGLKFAGDLKERCGRINVFKFSALFRP